MGRRLSLRVFSIELVVISNMENVANIHHTDLELFQVHITFTHTSNQFNTYTPIIQSTHSIVYIYKMGISIFLE